MPIIVSGIHTNIKIGKLFSDNINEWAVDFHSNHPSFFC
jgi:hypothetical protein